MILADKIIEERKKNGWTQEDLAQKLGVSRQSVSKWESAGAIPDLKKIIQLADLFGVSTDYLLKDEVEKENTETICDTDCELHRVSMEEANTYMDEKKKAAPMLANATTLCILSPIPLFLISTFNDGLAIGIACAILLGMVALAVFIFIKTGIKLSSLQYLEQEPFETEYGVTGLVKEKNQNYQEHYSFCLACGVVLCILSVVPLIIVGCMEASDYVCTLCLAVLLILVSVGVNILIRVSTIKSSYETLLQEGDYTKKEKRAKKKNGIFIDTQRRKLQLVFKQKIAIINKAGEKTVERLIAGVMKALLRENKHGVHIVPLGFFNRTAAHHGTAFFGGS